jgi:hypothetical protein
MSERKPRIMVRTPIVGAAGNVDAATPESGLRSACQIHGDILPAEEEPAFRAGLRHRRSCHRKGRRPRDLACEALRVFLNVEVARAAHAG